MSSNHQYDSWLIALEADKGWAYDKYYLKYLVVPILLIYSAWVMIVPASQEEIISNNNNNNTRYYYYVSPEGVRMTLVKPFDRLRLLGHSVSGVIMIICSIIQKHSGAYMLESMQRKQKKKTTTKKSSSSLSPSPSRNDDDYNNNQDSYYSFLLLLFSRFAHKNVTSTIMLACLSFMSIAGFIMRTYSTLENFGEIMYLFVSPWIILGTAIYVTAKLRFCRLHVLIGNALLWSCFAVVFARLLGAVLQRLTSEVRRDMVCGGNSFCVKYLVPDVIVDLGDGAGYYAGIAASTVIFGVFLSVEAILFFKRCNEVALKKKRK